MTLGPRTKHEAGLAKGDRLQRVRVHDADADAEGRGWPMRPRLFGPDLAETGGARDNRREY